MKKFFLVGLFTVMGLALFAQTEADFNVTLTADSTGVVITGYTGRATTVRIPATIQGMPVREIGDRAFNFNTTITSVVIPEGVTSILGDYDFGAFRNCWSLTSVTIPEGVTFIGENAFSDCTRLTNITLPSTVRHIGENAFLNCRALASITIPEGITRIEPFTFSGTALTSITIPEGVTIISTGSFSECKALTTVNLSSTVNRIEDSFIGCTALTTFTIPSEVESVYFHWNAFLNCNRLNLASQASLKRVGYTGSF